MTTGVASGMVIARVYREGFGTWWAEVFTPCTDSDPPTPDFLNHKPPWPDGYYRRGIELRQLRWTARRAADKMRGRLLEGLPAEKPSPRDNPSRLEVV